MKKTLVVTALQLLVAVFPCVLAQETVLPYSPTVIPHTGETCPPQSIRDEIRYNITEEIRTLIRNSTIVTTETPTGAGCGGTGWRQVAFINMTDPSYNCPSGWQLTSYSKRTCGRTRTGSPCESVTFSTAGQQYSKVCGRIIAYQNGATVAFYPYSSNSRSRTLEDVYVDGVSLTHGPAGSREHIWTFAGGLTENPSHGLPNEICACDSASPTVVPDYVGSDYFCESGLNTPWDSRFIFRPDDPIWDGMDCASTSTCCTFNSPPWFVKNLQTSTTDDLEVRICEEFGINDTPIELLELYVQ